MPDAPPAWAAVERGLSDTDPEIRELAIAVAATGPFRAWRMIDAHVLYEPEQWLRRFCAHVLTERHEELLTHAPQSSRRQRL